LCWRAWATAFDRCRAGRAGKGGKKGVAVVRCSRTGSGVVDRNVEINDDKLGFIAGMELNAQKARIPPDARPDQDQST
jgi:hypothetical protein